jgi:hypothetical protein
MEIEEGAANPVKVAVLGVGRFGGKVAKTLQELSGVSLIWESRSHTRWWELELPDWIFICSPHAFHFEQAKYFLERGTNVFVEKPASLNVDALYELYKIADLSGARLYVDDVYAWSVQTLPSKIKHHYKSKATDANFVDLIAYHYFYLIFYEKSPDCFPKFTSTRVKKGGGLFSLDFGAAGNYDFDFETSAETKDVSTDFNNEINPLRIMCSAVITGSADFKRNRKGAIFATRMCTISKQKIFGTIAVVGGGIYGSTAAIRLSVAGYQVTLFEKKDTLISSASAVNQYRVHEGFHYPRSPETRDECRQASVEFRSEYARSIVSDYEHYYSVSRDRSRTDARSYLRSMSSSGLEFEPADNFSNCDVTVLTSESSYSPKLLREICFERLFACGVTVLLGLEAKNSHLACFDRVVFATYRDINDENTKPYNLKYQIVEKIAVKVPSHFRNKSLVVMDGPFFSIDPHPDFQYHVIGAVKEANHFVLEGDSPPNDERYSWNLDTGELNEKPDQSNREEILDLAQKYLDFRPEYVGSYFVTKTIMAKKESTDERRFKLTIDRDRGYFFLLGGKVSAASIAATHLLHKLREL